MLLDMANATNTVAPPECVRALGAAWKCAIGMYRMPLIRTPYLLVASQYDAFQLDRNLAYWFKRNHSWPSPQEDYKSWADHFAATTRTQLHHLNHTAAPPRGVLSWSCYSHAESYVNNFFKLRGGGFSMAEALQAALLNVTGIGHRPMPFVVEECHGGMDCG